MIARLVRRGVPGLCLLFMTLLATMETQAVAQEKVRLSSSLIDANYFDPIAPGVWRQLSSSETQTLNSARDFDVDRFASASKRIKRLGFMNGSNGRSYLIELRKTTTANYGILVIRNGGAKFHQFTGEGPPIHSAVDYAGVSISDADEALAYVRFFNSSISGEDGPFFVVSPSDPGYSAVETALRIDVTELQGGKKWKILAPMLYGGNIFEVNLEVTEDGKVTMVDDRPIREYQLAYEALETEAGARYAIATKTSDRQPSQSQTPQAPANRYPDRDPDDKEPSEFEMQQAVARSTFAGSFVTIDKLGSCIRLGAYNYRCRYRVLGINTGDFWRSPDGPWYFKIVSD